MDQLLPLLLQYGYLIVFGCAFAEQMGLPLPAVPIMIGMGALARSGEFSLVWILLSAFSASLAADLIWYQLGARYGRTVLRSICKVSLVPDSCVRRTENAFTRYGLWTLPLAKFVPGLNAAAVPLAGMIKTPAGRFLLFDAVGLFLWAGVYTSLGYIFSREIEAVIVYLSRLGTSLAAVAGAALLAYVGIKYLQRRRFLKALVGARITPEELKSKLDSGEKLILLDVRNQLEHTTEPIRIPGAFHVVPDFDIDRSQLQTDREIVVYCT
jgi:membrane protein DedA with SNARE-associated domain